MICRKAMQRDEHLRRELRPGGKQPIVLLKTADGYRFLPIWIGHAGGGRDPDEAAGRGHAAADDARPAERHPRELDARGGAVTVTELRDNTFYARITFQMNGPELEIDSRPSDAIAIAVRAEAPIFAADDVIEESAIEFEGEDGPENVAAIGRASWPRSRSIQRVPRERHARPVRGGRPRRRIVREGGGGGGGGGGRFPPDPLSSRRSWSRRTRACRTWHGGQIGIRTQPWLAG